MAVFFMVMFLGNSIHGTLTSTGAFEMSLNGE